VSFPCRLSDRASGNTAIFRRVHHRPHRPPDLERSLLHQGGIHRRFAAGSCCLSNEAPRIPHEPTADQFFDETQFDAYRRLGFELMERTIPRTTTVFSTAKDLFDRILDAQRAISPVQSTNFQRMTDQFIEPEKLAMNRRTSVVYDRQLYPEMEVSEAQRLSFTSFFARSD
jgi:hypothetical protein